MPEYLLDNSLNLNEKGLLAILLNLPEDFEITIKSLRAFSGDSMYMMKTTLQQLKKKGYLKAELSTVQGRIFNINMSQL